MTHKTTFFGLEIIDDKYVREADIARLPFADFWRDSAIGSTMIGHPGTDEHFVYLHDWERFAEMFISTGRHQYMPTRTHQQRGAADQKV